LAVHAAEPGCDLLMGIMMPTLRNSLALLLPAVLLLAATVAEARQSQLYFLGRTVINDDVATPRTEVYLRWDVLEGQLPPDVERFRIRRNGVDIGPDLPATAVRSVDEIAVFYAEPGWQRMKLETITRLSELAAERGDPFSANRFASELHARISSSAPADRFWSLLASKTDFNIARARNRAWIDTAPVGAGADNEATYELFAVNASDTEVKVGEVRIDLDEPQQPLGATDFRQILLTARDCTVPEASKDHYTVMLDWTSPGADVISDRVAAQTYLAGFDLYRTTENLGPAVTVAPARDIAALTASAGYDSRGRFEMQGLEKVNVTLLLDPGKPAVDEDWQAAKRLLLDQGFDLDGIGPDEPPVDPKWIEARDRLMRAGLKPGDRRAYYLVPRDFTGNYGPTAATVVQVPLMTRPPAPWNIRTFADRTTAALTGEPRTLALTWDEIELETYIESKQGTRLFCNATEARSTGILEYVPIGETCENGRRRSIRLDIGDYRVYRFENFDVAGRFKDSDGDGVEDSAEMPDINGDGRYDAFERSAGTQCDPLLQPPNAPNYLIWADGQAAGPGQPRLVRADQARQFNPNALPIVRLTDQVPAGTEIDPDTGEPIDNRDKVYWYRVMSEATTPAPVGRLSYMSAPQRGIFPNRKTPPPPDVEVTKPGQRPQGCRIEADSSQKDWSFEEDIDDGSTEKELTFRLSCATESYSESQVQLPDGAACREIKRTCGDAQDVTLTFQSGTANTGDVQCEVDIPNDVEFCQSGAVSIVPDFVEGIPVEPGDLVPGGATVTAKVPDGGNYCIALYENIDGSFTRVVDSCTDPEVTYTPSGGQFCGYAVVSDENNNISATVQIPCTLTPTNPKPPGPPQILVFEVDDDFARFSFRLPAEQASVALARLVYQPPLGTEERTVEGIPVIDDEPASVVSYTIPVEALQATKDRYCLSMLAVGRDDGTGDAPISDWGPERCYTRTATGEDLPAYLPWPPVPGVPQVDPKVAAFIDPPDSLDFGLLPPFLYIFLAGSEELASSPNGLFEFDDCVTLAPGQPDPNVVPDSNLAGRDFTGYQCFTGGLAKFRRVLEEELGFVVYRQRRIGGAAGAWIQVSPLIDYVHFDRSTREIIKGRFDSVWTLNDPYIEIVKNGDASRIDVIFVDRYPALLGSGNFQLQGAPEYRYQVVYFDDANRPEKWWISDWFRGAP